MADQFNKLEVGEIASPSAVLINDAKAEFTVEDNAGHVITLRKPGILAQYNLIKMLGEAASNQVYVGMVMPVLFVSKIDGEVVPMPRTQRELDALIQRLDENGIQAISDGIQAKFGTPDPEKDKADVKN